MKKAISFVVLMMVLLSAVSQATITVPYTFSPFTTISSTQMNANFSAFSTNALDKRGDTMTGALNGTAATFTGTVTGNLFSGSGASLTALVPTTLTGAGRIPMAASYYPVITSVSTTYNVNASTDDDVDCDATLAGFTVTLPTPVGNTGKTINVKKTDSSNNVVTVATAFGLIDGLSTYTLEVQGTNITFRSTGSNWEIR